MTRLAVKTTELIPLIEKSISHSIKLSEEMMKQSEVMNNKFDRMADIQAETSRQVGELATTMKVNEQIRVEDAKGMERLGDSIKDVKKDLKDYTEGTDERVMDLEAFNIALSATNKIKSKNSDNNAKIKITVIASLSVLAIVAIFKLIAPSA